MRFTATFLGLFLLLFGARSSILESCGADGQVIDKKTLVSSGGKEITFTTTARPGFAALRNTSMTPSSIRKRQISQCGTTSSCTSFVCDTISPQPTVTDCADLTTLLIGLNETFESLPLTETHFFLGTCFYRYVNLDTVTYSVCTRSFGELGDNAVAYCLTNVMPTGTFTAGSCFSPEVPGNSFVVESGSV